MYNEITQKRIEGIDLTVALCSRKETGKRHHINLGVDETPIKEEPPGRELNPSIDSLTLYLDASQS